MHVGGTISTQTAHNPDPNTEQPVCQVVEETTKGQSKADLVLAGLQGMQNPMKFKVQNTL